MYFMRKRNEKIESCGSGEPGPVEIERRPTALLPFSRVQKIFHELSAKDLCNLMELSSFAPSDVLAVVPNATSKQLGEFFGIVENRSEKIKSCGSGEPRLAEIERRPTAWLPFSKVQKIFADLSPKDLCNLVQYSSYAPSDVLAVVPNATSKQLGDYFEIVEKSVFSQQKNQTKQSCGSSELPVAEIERQLPPRLPFSRVQKIFPGLSTRTLCKLLELTSFKPSDIIAVVPDATHKQLGCFFECVQETVCPQKVDLLTVGDQKKQGLANSDCKKTDVGESPAGVYSKFLDEIKVSMRKISSEQNAATTFTNQFEKKIIKCPSHV